MKILMATRRSGAAILGGDTIQIQSLAFELEKLGHGVQIDFEGRLSPSKFDIVHVFNLDRPQDIIPIAKKAKAIGKPIVLTPVFVDYREFDSSARMGLFGRISRLIGSDWTARAKVLARAVKNREFHSGSIKGIFPGVFYLQKALLDKTDFFLPNSISEMKRLCMYFDMEMDSVQYEKIENGVDSQLFRMKGDEEKREGVLCISRVEGIKNQLNLVRAMEKLPWNLTLIGNVAPNHKSYFARVLKASGNNVRYLGQLSQNELVKFYQQAKVHALPSWFETTGLSTLEAVAMGCNIVVTGKGDTREYFRDGAFYCEPDDVGSIRDAIQEAYEAPVNTAFRERLMKDCTWEKAAEKTLRVYERLLDGQ